MIAVGRRPGLSLPRAAALVSIAVAAGTAVAVVTRPEVAAKPSAPAGTLRVRTPPATARDGTDTARRISGVLRGIGKARRDGRRRLAAARAAREQAAAASHIARAYRAGAARLDVVASTVSPASVELTAALKRTADVYVALATAARARDARRFRAARHRIVKREADVARVLATARLLG